MWSDYSAGFALGLALDKGGVRFQVFDSASSYSQGLVSC